MPLNQKRIVEWFAVVAGIGLAACAAFFVWWGVSLPGEEEHSVGAKLTAAANQVSSSPDQQVLFSPQRGQVDLNAYGFTDPESQDRLLVVLRRNMTNSPTKVRVAFYPARVINETKANGQTFSEVVKSKSIREVKLN